MGFRTNEKKDLTFAGIMISLAFAILLSGGINSILSFNSRFILIFFIAFFTAGIGFLLHEIMHKYVAQNYGLTAEFKAFYPMLWIALGLSFFGFIFAAPGAVFINGYITKERNGKISLAGPLTNIFLAILFLILIFFVPETGFLAALAKFGLTINALLGAFNMIPVMPFDGGKVILWDKTIYGITTAVAVGLYVISFFV